MSVKVPPGHLCEAPDCEEPAPSGATCSPACRARKWKADTGYGDPRRRRRRSGTRSTRYAIVAGGDCRLEVLAFDTASSKAAVERAVGIRDREDLVAIPADRLPAAA